MQRTTITQNAMYATYSRVVESAEKGGQSSGMRLGHKVCCPYVQENIERQDGDKSIFCGVFHYEI